ncbi:MAG: exonuclease domain-containing protein [Clostridia bacterium]|nr:exonuclease domain-containing protein [Clostridia bacterium]
MYYITLDLEWNQAYAQKALAVQRQLSSRLRGEVIQIGAVKLDENMQPCGSYQIIVKPKYFKKLHRHVSELTGITQDQMDLGTPFPEAEISFRKWCGNDFVFLTWGPDDIPMLKENFNVHGIDSKWLERVYDLQVIFNRQTDGSSRQRSLEYAMEYFEIPQRLPAHDALNDAYFTALVAAKLDVPGGIAAYNSEIGEHLETSVIGDADAGEDGYVTIGELLEDDIVAAPICPLCRAKLDSVGKPLHSKGQKYTFIYNCKKDGDMILTLKLHRNFNDTWRAKRTLDKATDEKLEAYRLGLEKSNIRRKSTKKNYRSKKRVTSVQTSTNASSGQ